MSLSQKDYDLVFTRYMDANHNGEFDGHYSTFDSIRWRDGVTIPDQATFEAAIEAAVLDFPNYVDPAQTGYQKLLDLGLTEAEATALTGYTTST